MAGATFVLVPGAGGSAWYWHRLVAELTGRGHRAVAVELPAQDDSAGLVEYADAVVAACSASPAAAGREGELVLVAQSMAGLIAPELARRLPASLVVLLNAMIPAPGELPGEWWQNTGQGEAQRAMDRREGRSVDAEFDPVTYFLHDLPPELLEDALANAPEQSDTPFGRPGPTRPGLTCRSAYWPGAPTGSSRWSSSAGWRASGSAPRWARSSRYRAGISPRSAIPRRWPTGWSSTWPSSPPCEWYWSL